jgi:hypothetical protein
MTWRGWLLVFGFALLVLGTTAYWAVIYLYLDPAAWFSRFPYVSPVADLWMAGTGLVALVGLIGQRPFARVAAYLSAGACVFIGLTAFHYNLRTGQLFAGTVEQRFEIAIPAALLLLGLLTPWLLRGAGRAS